ncbi:MAG: pyridoxamine 5'-phosphate oxidase [Gammaproteobacteria bacterium]
MTEPVDIANLRREFMTRPLRRGALAPDPLTQFQLWFSDALAASTLDPNAMSVATVGVDGQPSLRTVLLKHFDARGFVFYTNLDSHKAHDIRHNPRVALLLYWAEIGRQVRITGLAARTSAAEDASYFSSRPRDSQLGAWASPQSQLIDTRDSLEAKFARIKTRFDAGEVPLPDFWGGYRVIAETVEFWQARENRLHDRFIYSASNSGWTIQRLAP